MLSNISNAILAIARRVKVMIWWSNTQLITFHSYLHFTLLSETDFTDMVKQHIATYVSHYSLKRILRIRFNRYGEKLVITFQLLGNIYKICENHKNWSKTVARRAVSIFQTGFSHPVDPEFRIFLAKDNLHKKICPQSPCLKFQVAYSLQNVIGKILKFLRVRDSFLQICIDDLGTLAYRSISKAGSF